MPSFRHGRSTAIPMPCLCFDALCCCYTLIDMRRISIATVGLLLSSMPGNSQDHALRGLWQFRAPTASPDYRAVMLVDAAGRATYDSPSDAGRPAKFLGYVERNDSANAQILLTNGTNVIRASCMVQSADLLQCQFFRDSGRTSDTFSLVRVGAGPQTLEGLTRQ